MHGNGKKIIDIDIKVFLTFFNPGEIISIKCITNFTDVINFSRCYKSDILHAKSNIRTYMENWELLKKSTYSVKYEFMEHFTIRVLLLIS